MQNKSIINRFLISLLFLCGLTNAGFSQISLGGPTCGQENVEYNYFVTGNYNSSDNFSWIISNGVSSNGNSSESGTGLTFLRIKFTGSGSISVQCSSGNASLSVTVFSALNPGSITANGSQTINYNATPGQISCSVASGGSCVSTYNYQWQQSIDNINWTDMSGKTDQNLSFSSGLTQTTYFRRKVTNGSSGPEGYSNTATVFVNPPLTAGSIFPTSQNIFVGVVPSSIGGGSANGGSCGGYTYQWEYSTDGTTFFIISNTNSMGYSPDALDVTTYFRRKVTCSGVVAFTAPIVVNVYQHLAPGSISPSFANILYNTSPGQLTGTVATGGICTSYSYQWQQSTDNINWTDIQSTINQPAINQNYTPGNLTTLTYFRRKVICGIETVYSNVSEISLYNSPLAPGQIITASFEVEYNTTPSTISATTSAGGICSSYNYQWQFSPDNVNFTDIPNATSQNCIFSAGQTQSYFYRRVAQCGNETAVTNSISISIIAEAGAVTCSQAIEAGGSSSAFTLSGSRGGPPGISIAYQWESSPDEITWTTVSGATSASYTPLSLTATTYYRVRVGFGTYNLFSNTVRVKVKATPNTSVVPNQTVLSMPSFAGLDANNMNFLRTRTITKRGIANPEDADALTSNTDVTQVTDYLDGLGRPIQTVVKNGTPSGADLITTTCYDNFGRVAQKYLPYTDNQSTGNFRTNASTQQPGFYNSFFNNSENYYYSNSVIESSPLNRVLQETGPGNSWTGSAKGIRKQDRFNRKEEDIKVWSINTDNGAIPAVIGVYNKGELFVSETTGESESKTIEYKNKEGQMILKKVLVTDTYCEGYSGWLSTYYIYDDFSLLRWVIQPKGVDWLLANSWNLSSNTTLQNEMCFRYEYDAKGRMIIKKVPGAGEVYMIYDARDRLVFTQDVNMRGTNKWLATLYDGLNRPVTTGFITYTGDRSSLQSYVEGASLSASSQTINGSGTPSLAANSIFTDREPGRTLYQATSSIELAGGFQSEEGANFVAEIVGGGSGASFTDNVAVYNIPLPSNNNFIPLTSTYYDNYAWTSKTYNTTNNSQLDKGGNSNEEDLPSQSSVLVKGIVTGARVRVLENPANPASDPWISTVNFYDDKSRPIQVQSENHMGGLDITTSRYDFSGKVLSSYSTFNNQQGNVSNLRIKTNFEYDAMGRVNEIWKTINDDITKKTRITKNEYDALGQLVKKSLGRKKDSNGNYTVDPLESLTYDYNIRGWMLGANRNYAKNIDVNNTDNYFGFELGYDKNSTLGSGWNAFQLNGNIAGMIWKSTGDDAIRRYDFGYDPANRILAADFNQYASGSFNKTENIDFSVSNLSYDANGNILTMSQKGLKLTASDWVDQLRYTYVPGTNKLLNVVDFNNDTQTKLGDFRTAASHTSVKSALTPASLQAQFDAVTDYNYDANGNLSLDNNKDISSITYNYLNLPSVISVTGKGTITYVYDAGGNKLKKIVNETGQPAKTTVYVAGAVYENDVLQFLSQEEGRIRFAKATTSTCAPQGNRFIFDYFVKDHLGNVRMVLTEQQESICYIPATVEDATWQEENKFYDIVEGRRIERANTGAPQSNFGNRLYQVHGGLTNQKTGLGITLKVMAGDQVRISAESYYTLPPGGSPGSTLNMAVSDLLATFAGSGAISATKGPGITAGDIQGLGTNLTNISNFITRTPGSYTAKAYLNWILFDDQLKYVSAGADPVETGNSTGGGVYKLHNAFINSPVSVRKNGYLYIFVSNESNLAVFFDNLAVTHVPGPILEETHYYPFGLTMAGISSKAAGGIINKKGIQGKELQSKEFSDGSGLELYDFLARQQDPQLGRWWTVDPKAEKYYSSSPYNFVDNNPITRVDPTGKDWFYYQAKGEDKKTWHYHDGHKAKYINDKGKEKTVRNGYSHLVAFVGNGKVNSEGAKMGTLFVYNQDKVQMTAPGAFTGGGGNPAVNNGMYMMRMDIKDSEGPKEMNAARDNPATTHGAQKIPNRYIQTDGQPTNTPTMDAYDVGGAWGRGRVRLNNVDENLKIIQTPNDRGAFLHGKLRTDINYTHGCICERSEAVFDYLWNNVNSKVPLIVQ
jgi:RHS repeat-associated protein